MEKFNLEDLIGTKIHDKEFGAGTIENINDHSIVIEFSRAIGVRKFFFPNAFLSKRMVHSNINIQRIINDMDYVDENYYANINKFTGDFFGFTENDEEDFDEDDFMDDFPEDEIIFDEVADFEIPEECKDYIYEDELIPDYSHPLDIDELLNYFKCAINSQPVFQIPLRKTLEAIEEMFVGWYIETMHDLLMNQIPENLIYQVFDQILRQYYPLLAFAILNDNNNSNSKISKYKYSNSDDLSTTAIFANYYHKFINMIEDSKFGYASYEIDGNILKENFKGNELFHVINRQHNIDFLEKVKRRCVRPNWIFSPKPNLEIEECYKITPRLFNEQFDRIYVDYKLNCNYEDIDLLDFSYYEMLKVVSALKVFSIFEMEKKQNEFICNFKFKSVNKKYNKFLIFISNLSKVEVNKTQIIIDSMCVNKKVVSVDKELIYFHKYNNSVIIFIYNLYKDNLPLSFEKMIWINGNFTYLNPISRAREKNMLTNINELFVRMPNVLIRTNVKYHYNDSYKITAEYDAVLYDTCEKILIVIECKWYNLNGRGKGRYITDKKIFDSLEYRSKKNAYIHSNTLEFMYQVFGHTYQVDDIKELMVLDKYIGDIEIDGVVAFETIKSICMNCHNLKEFINGLPKTQGDDIETNISRSIMSVGPYKLWLIDYVDDSIND